MKKINHSSTIDIKVSKIKEGNLAIRKYYSEEGIDGLGQSISEIGTIYPLVVKSLPDGEYGLIIGSRRLRAAKKLKLEKIPAIIISNLDGRSQLELMLAENLHREDLTPFEEAWAILKLINDYKMNLKQVAKRIGRDGSFITRRLQLLSLPQEVQEMVSDKQLSLAHVSALANLDTPEAQVSFARIATHHKLDDKEMVTLIQDQLHQQSEQRRQSPAMSWQKVSLRVGGFAKWLKATIPTSIDVSRANDKYALREALEKLQKEIRLCLINIEKGG